MEAEAGGSQTEGSLDLQRMLRLLEPFNEPFFKELKVMGLQISNTLLLLLLLGPFHKRMSFILCSLGLPLTH